jgi:hypothetical protein
MSTKSPKTAGRLSDLVKKGIDKAVGWSRQAQKEPGYWAARLECSARTAPGESTTMPRAET